MSIVAVHGPYTWGDAADQGNDKLGFASVATATGTANNAAPIWSGATAAAQTATSTAQALQPTRVTGY